MQRVRKVTDTPPLCEHCTPTTVPRTFYFVYGICDGARGVLPELLGQRVGPPDGPHLVEAEVVLHAHPLPYRAPLEGIRVGRLGRRRWCSLVRLGVGV